MLIYNSTETDFENNGLGFLQDFTTNPQILEQLNGELSLSFEYSINGLNSEYLIEDNIIKAKYDNSYQLFRIKRKVKTLKRISIYATHIFYDLANNFIEDVRPTNKTCANALNDILTNTQYSHNFTGFSDIPTTNTAYYIRKNPVEAIISVDNSLINNWAGELERDNHLIKILARRGTDKGVKIAYGKNLKQFEETVDMTNLATRIMPVGANGLLLPEKYIDSPLINNYPMTFIKTITFDDIAVSEELTQEQAYELLRNRVNELYENGIDKPLVNIKIDWQDLSRTEEYFNKYNVFETVRLGDTVTVEIKGIELQTRVIKVVYDCLLEKYINFELGNFQPSFFNNQIQVIKEQIQLNNPNLLQQAKDNATEQITSALGGYIYKTQSELFIMDTNDPSTATKVWRWNLNGLGYSSEGINGPYELAMTQDGQIVADFISTGEMAVERITGLADTLSSIDLGISDITSTVTDHANLIAEEQTKTSELQQTVDGLNLAVKRVGGNNLLPNSTLKLGLDKNVTVSGTVTFEDFMDVVKNTISKTSYKINNGYVKYDRVFCEPGTYTLSFKNLRKANTNPYVEVYAGLNLFLDLNVKEDAFEEVILNIENTVGYIDIIIGCNENYCLISDVMLNSGPNKLTFSLYPGEVVSTNYKFSNDGMELTSSDKKTKLVANAEELAIYNTENNEKQVSFNKDNTIMNRATVDTRFNVGKLRHTVLDNGDIILTFDD